MPRTKKVSLDLPNPYYAAISRVWYGRKWTNHDRQRLNATLIVAGEFCLAVEKPLTFLKLTLSLTQGCFKDK